MSQVACNKLATCQQLCANLHAIGWLHSKLSQGCHESCCINKTTVRNLLKFEAKHAMTNYLAIQDLEASNFRTQHIVFGEPHTRTLANGGTHLARN